MTKSYVSVFGVYATFPDDPDDNWELIKHQIFDDLESAQKYVDELNEEELNQENDYPNTKYIICKMTPCPIYKTEITENSQHRVLTL